MALEKLKSRMQYFIACVSEFAQAHAMSHQTAYAFLEKYQGMDFLMKCYEAEHTLSFRDAVEDLEIVCRKNGGRI